MTLKDLHHGPVVSSCANCELPCKCLSSSPPFLDINSVGFLECGGDSLCYLGIFDERHPRGKLDHLV